MHVAYYDGDTCVGKFPKGTDEHRLTDLNKSSKEIRVEASDDIGNIAATTFTINQDIPKITYGHVSRTPKSVFIKDVKVMNFPNDNDVIVSYLCDGLETVVCTWNNFGGGDQDSTVTEHELPGYDEKFEGRIIATATDVKKNYRAQCEINIMGKGK